MTTTLFHHHASCPSWCVNRHGLLDGEEDWVHTGWVTATAGGVMVKLTMSIDPNTHAVDGPYVGLATRYSPSTTPFPGPYVGGEADGCRTDQQQRPPQAVEPR